MRYSHNLRKYHSRPHNYLSTVILVASILAIGALVAVSHSDTLNLARDLALSTIRVFLAYFITLPIALIVVILITRKTKVEDFFVPVLDVAQSLPAFAFLPVMIALLGRGTLAISLFLTIEMIWPIVFTTLSAVKTTREDLAEAATIFQAKGARRLWHFILPSIFPAIVTGSIIGWGEAWETIVGAELIAGKNGIGAFIGKLNDSGNTFLFTVAVIILMLFLFVLNRLIWLPLLAKSTKYQTD